MAPLGRGDVPSRGSKRIVPHSRTANSGQDAYGSYLSTTRARSGTNIATRQGIRRQNTRYNTPTELSDSEPLPMSEVDFEPLVLQQSMAGDRDIFPNPEPLSSCSPTPPPTINNMQTGPRNRRPRMSIPTASSLDNFTDSARLAEQTNLADSVPSTGTLISGKVHQAGSQQTSVLSNGFSAEGVYQNLHPSWVVKIFLILIAFLHTKHHLSFRACGLILFCFQVIALSLGLGSDEYLIPTTLTTLFKRLNMSDQFKVYITCWKCHMHYDPDSGISPDHLCQDCQTDLFKPTPASTQLFNQLIGREEFPLPPAHLITPIRVLSSLLGDFLVQPGIIDEVDQWKTHKSTPGKRESIYDGHVWQSVVGHDKKPFFRKDDDSGDIRLGVTFSLDWFGRKTSNYGPSHSSGVMSFSVANLSRATRYRANNVLIACMPPGPNEQTSEQLQNYFKILIDDLILLYEKGVLMKLPGYPQGRRVRVALIGIICDHPAMCKVCGFADHAHENAPCTKCQVPHSEIFSEKSLRNEFPARDGEDHRKKCFEYRALTSEKERDAFFKLHGVRWTEFARLDYFDLVRWTLVDPMHNFLLGLAKTQWYHQWISGKVLRASTTKKPRELEVIHSFLETFESPLWAGRLPLRVGEPAGGSLTADEYKFAVTAPWAMIIPIVWDLFYSEAMQDHAKAVSKYSVDLAKYQAALPKTPIANQPNAPAPSALQAKKLKAPTPSKEPKLRMNKEEPRNFLRFATALKIIMGSSIYDNMIPRALGLLCDYLLGFRELYGSDSMKPNQHWCVHIGDQLEDYGPVYNFWAFLTERLNKILKNLNSNNWTGGQLEVSMMREFERGVKMEHIVRVARNMPENAGMKQIIDRMLSEGEAIGTVADAANLSGLTILSGVPASTHGVLNDALRIGLKHNYNSNQRLGRPQVHLDLDINHPAHTSVLKGTAQFYHHTYLDGRHIAATTQTKRGNAGSSIVMADVRGEEHAGEIRNIFRHKQPGVEQPSDGELFVEMAWMIPSDLTPVDPYPWEDFSELGIEIWNCGEYMSPMDPACPPMVIPFWQIQYQLCRGVITTTDPPLWMTTTLDRHLAPLEFEAEPD